MAPANGGSRRQAALIVQEQRWMTLRVPSFEPRSPYNLNAIPALWTLAIIAVVFLLRMASELLIPIVLAVLISYALEPLVSWEVRRGIPRMAAAAVLLGLVLVLSGCGAYALRDETLEVINALPEVAQRARALILPEDGAAPAQQVQRAAEILDGARASNASPNGDAAGSTGAVAALIPTAAGSLLTLAGNLTVVFFLVFFLLNSGEHFRRRLIEVAGTRLERRRVTMQIITDINRQIQRFLLVRVVTSTIVAVATWLVLAWMDVGQAAVWGILAGVFNSIPYFGPVIVSGGLLIVGLVQGGDWTRALEISGAALVVTSLEGWLLTPPLLGRAERMHVVVVFLGVLVWTWLWGGWGTLLAVPMLVVVKAVSDHVDSLRPLSRLMAP